MIVEPELREMAQRRVLIMRHAQTIPNAPTDFERALTNQGKHDAKKNPKSHTLTWVDTKQNSSEFIKTYNGNRGTVCRIPWNSN
jgi:hypothetical protein